MIWTRPKDVECPYCGAEQDIDHDDGYGYEEDETYQQECSECEKVFSYTTSVSYSYEVSKAPCLNGGEHDMSRWYKGHSLRDYRYRYCMNCDHREEEYL